MCSRQRGGSVIGYVVVVGGGFCFRFACFAFAFRSFRFVFVCFRSSPFIQLPATLSTLHLPPPFAPRVPLSHPNRRWTGHPAGATRSRGSVACIGADNCHFSAAVAVVLGCAVGVNIDCVSSCCCCCCLLFAAVVVVVVLAVLVVVPLVKQRA